MRIYNVRKYFFSKDYLVLVAGLILLILAWTININVEKPLIQLQKQDTALNINKNLLIFSSAGNKRLITNLLWIQTLIESDLKHYSNRDLNNWLYLRFNTISVLDPYFYENYLYGGQFLAIIKDDLEGANDIYQKGLNLYPDDYLLNYNAAFLNYFEMGNNEKGIKYLSKIVDHPRAPVFLRSILNKLMLSEGTDLETIYNLVLHNYETTRDENLKNKLKSDLYSIRVEIDLTCLNNQKTNCQFRDPDGNNYIRKGDKYFPNKEMRPFRITNRDR